MLLWKAPSPFLRAQLCRCWHWGNLISRPTPLKLAPCVPALECESHHQPSSGSCLSLQPGSGGLVCSPSPGDNDNSGATVMSAEFSHPCNDSNCFHYVFMIFFWSFSHNKSWNISRLTPFLWFPDHVSLGQAQLRSCHP